MISVRDANAMAEVNYYLKGIKQEDLNKIPKKLILFLNENASKEYKCDFDYNKPLKELNLLDETRGIIGMICYNYWCVTENQKEQYIKKLSKNEQQYQKIIHEIYNPNNLFKSKVTKVETAEIPIAIVEYKESIFTKIKNWFKRIL